MADPITAAIVAVVSWVAPTVSAATAMAVIGTATAVANAIVFAAPFVAAAGLTMLMTPRIGAGGSPIAFKADPAAPIAGVMGRFGVAGRQVHANTWGKDNLYLSFAVALSLGPIQSVEAFTANRVAVTFPGAQGLAAAVEPYKDKMWQTNRLGLPTDAYLSPPTGVSDGSPAMTEWTSSHTLPGIAHAFWTLKNNSKRASYESGVPAPLWTLHGMKLWDPRLDSTYPGGSGAQLRDDWTTWAYTEDPYLHALAWVRGHFKLNTDGTIDTTKRLAGIGAPDDAIDIGAFVEGANVADTNSWAIAGEWTTADDKWQVLAAMLQAGGGVPLNRGAKISCMVEAPRTSLLTLTGADIVGAVNLSVMASRRDRPNTIIPRVRLEAQYFEEVALGPVTSSTYMTEDGEETRTREISYPYVGDAKQGAELAGYGLANARETLTGTIPCKPHLLGLRAGDAFTVTEPELGLNGQKFVVTKRTFDPASAIVTLDVRSETDAKHAWALGRLADAPATPSLTAGDPIPTTPVDGDWTVAARSAESSGVQQPGLTVTGAAVGDNIGSVLIEYSTSSSGPWQQAYFGPPTIATVEINGLEGGTDYYVGITYWSLRGVPSVQLVKGPYTAPGMVAVADWGTTVTGRPSELTDGRIATALNGSGVLQTAIPSALADSSNLLRRTGGGVFTGSLAATQNTGALADLNTVGAAQIDSGAVTAAKLGSDAVTTSKVQQGSITPHFYENTPGAVIWTAESTEKTVQTDSVTVVRGAVRVTGLIDVVMSGLAGASSNGIFRLKRDGVELTNAQRVVFAAGSTGTWRMPSQVTLDYLDAPGAGTFTYTLTFQPSDAVDGQVLRRSMFCQPLEG